MREKEVRREASGKKSNSILYISISILIPSEKGGIMKKYFLFFIILASFFFFPQNSNAYDIASCLPCSSCNAAYFGVDASCTSVTCSLISCINPAYNQCEATFLSAGTPCTYSGQPSTCLNGVCKAVSPPVPPCTATLSVSSSGTALVPFLRA